MKIFKLKGQIIFEAKDLDDAFRKLSRHFEVLKNGSPTNDEIEMMDGSDIELSVDLDQRNL